MQDITRLKSNPLFEEDINGWELNDGWEHIKSQYISGRQESKIPVKHRLYIGCQNQDMWKLAQLFKSKCESQQIPFYFKLGSSSERDDKMVVYADTDNLANYISAFQEIAQEHPEIVERCGEPPALTGTIDNWIGIGDEPPLKSNGENQSYNSLRADIFEAAIEETLLSSIKDFKGQNVTFDGKQVKFNDLFIEQAAGTIQTPSKQKNQEKQSQPSQTTTLQTNKEENAINKQTKTIRTVDIIDLIKPELLQQKIELPNGAKIPARQYIQEVVAPHIPSSGKFILKSNDRKISATQFIEEAVMFAGQENYNGDINALLDALTVANGGTVEVKEPKKALRGQALKQKMKISPAQAQKMQEEQEFSEHEEHDKKQKEEQQKLEESNFPKLPISKVDRTVTRGKVTTSEVNHSQKAMAERSEMSQLMFLGSRATEDQKKRLEQLRGIYQVNQDQQNQQRQSNGMGR